MRAKILIVDDDRDILLGLENRVTWMGHEPLTADNGKDALRLIEEEAPDLVLLDLELPFVSGLDVLKQVRDASNRSHPTEEGSPPASAAYTTPLIIILTAFGTIERAVQAMQLGAFDFVPKPFTADHLTVVINKALATVNLHRQVDSLRQEVDDHYEPIVAVNKHMSAQLAVAKQAAASTVTVLTCLKTSYSGTNAAPLPGLTNGNRAKSRSPKGALYFSTKSATCRSPCKATCCGYFRIRRSTGWVGLKRCEPMYVSSQPQIETCSRRFVKGPSARTCTIVLPSSRSRCRPCATGWMISPPSRSTFSAGQANWGCTGAIHSARLRYRRCNITPGRAISANWRTCSLVPSSYAPEIPLSRSISRCPPRSVLRQGNRIPTRSSAPIMRAWKPTAGRSSKAPWAETGGIRRRPRRISACNAPTSPNCCGKNRSRANRRKHPSRILPTRHEERQSLLERSLSFIPASEDSP
ncbi:MAG: sigma-54-dependent Fis family transcriptional regulator [Nitrospirae bacterium]|nr:sigma-54-dependent Fis family transcriptional regulator [Nitrospirota bacterium]